jgi:hypothetical protein
MLNPTISTVVGFFVEIPTVSGVAPFVLVRARSCCFVLFWAKISHEISHEICCNKKIRAEARKSAEEVNQKELDLTWPAQAII